MNERNNEMGDMYLNAIRKYYMGNVSPITRDGQWDDQLIKHASFNVNSYSFVNSTGKQVVIFKSREVI